jgi:hypothetical protein
MEGYKAEIGCVEPEGNEAFAQPGTDLPKGIVVRIGASPNAGCLGILVAQQTMRAAVRQQPGLLVREIVSRIDALNFQGDLVFEALAKTNLADFPYAL